MLVVDGSVPIIDVWPLRFSEQNIHERERERGPPIILLSLGLIYFIKFNASLDQQPSVSIANALKM